MDITESPTLMLKITDQILPLDAYAQLLRTSVRFACTHPSQDVIIWLLGQPITN